MNAESTREALDVASLAGAILLAILILFVYKDEELGFLSLKKKHE